MKNISYDSIKNRIKREQKRHICMCIDVIDKKIQKYMLELFSPSNMVLSEKEYKYFTRIVFADFQVIEYQSDDNNNIENKLIILNPDKDNNVFEISKKTNMEFGSGIINEEYKLYNHEKGLNYFIKKSSKYINGSLVETGYNLVEKSISTGQYLVKNYNFVYDNEKCIILEIDGESFVLNTQQYINRIELANAHIQKLETILEANLNSCLELEENTKVYQVKRKVRKKKES